MNQTEKSVLEYLDQNQKRLYKLLSDLIRVDTQNGVDHGSESRCENLILGEYRRLGLETARYCPDEVPGVKESAGYLNGRGTDSRPNFSGTYHAEAPKGRVMLAAHTDTMPTGDRKLWSVDPLGGVIRDGRIYGRGASDNKFGIASSILAFEAVRAAGVELDHDVVLESYCDEEYGGGNGALAASLREKCDTIINMDGGNYEIWSCSMGGQGMTIRVKANEPQDSASLVIDALQVIRDELKFFFQKRYEELAVDPYFVGTDMQRSAVRIHEFKAGDNACDLDFGNMNFVYYSNKPQEVLHAELCEAERRIRARLGGMGVGTDGFQPTTRFFYCLSLPSKDPMLQKLKGAAEEVAGRAVKISGACMSDLSIFLKFGSPRSVNFGLLRDFRLYGGAHQPDEFVTLEQLLQHCKAIALFLLRWCTRQNLRI
ncbi:MAG: M20 family metallopeptidase [Oscillospiraceae bacterium]|nr:M20 family metallopeptidase [Oscillospiraceae bacterium]